jgi:Na+-driven multidrug efflux pump
MAPVNRKAREAGERNQRKLDRAINVGHYLSLIIAITFIVVYWMVGMYNVINPDLQ